MTWRQRYFASSADNLNLLEATFMMQTLTSAQRDIVTLWYHVNASLSAYRKLLTSYGSASAALAQTTNDWQAVGVHQAHLTRFTQPDKAEQALVAIEQALTQGRFGILFQEDSDYPSQLKQIFDPPPLLFYRGNKARLLEAQIAIVGSRKPTAQAEKITFDMAQYLAEAGYVITSGLAVGVDRYAHLGALAAADNNENNAKGRTIGVMGTGIEVYYPKHHERLFAQIVSQGGCLISELLPGTQANKHTFPRRNRLVAGLSMATIVSEAAVKSGSLITARLTSEQGKQVFAIPSSIDNINAEGCHHLIREGATLIYHPDQVIEDVQLQNPTTFNRRGSQSDNVTNNNNSQFSSASKPPAKPSDITTVNPAANHAIAPIATQKQGVNIKDVAAHLQPLYEQLDWSGKDLDALKAATKLETAALLGQLMELELLGIIVQQGGRYLRV